MSRIARRARTAVTLAALTLGVLSAAAPFAAASVTSTVPFKDSNIDGWLTFCNRNDQPVTSGSLYTVPFAWKTISSAKAPAGYRSVNARAALYAYQPIKYVDPGDWSGSLLTAATEFTNPSHPVAQATNLDVPLIGFTQAYPAHWQGLVEVRMLFSGVNESQLQAPYPAAILRVTGSRWTLVEGGGGSCSQGQGLSMESMRLTKSKLAKQQTALPAAKSSTAPAGASGTGGQSSGGSNAGTATNLAASSSPSGLSGVALAGIGVGAFAVVFGGLAAVSRLRRRTTT
jgi:hypothetical protein